MKLSWAAVAVLAFYLAPDHAEAQEVESSVDISEATAITLCNRLKSAVQGNEAARASKLIRSFPIEVDRDGRTTLIEDDTDFIAKFDLIFDSKLRAALFSSEGCKPVSSPDGTSWLANGEVAISQVESEPEPRIDAISPPKDVRLLSSISNKIYEEGAAKFFKELQRAVATDDREAVAEMCMYPIEADTNGKPESIEDRAELIRDYTKIFTPGVKEAIAGLHAPIHMGWRGFMTDRGELWLDAVAGTHVYRVVRINGTFAEPRTQK